MAMAELPPALRNQRISMCVIGGEGKQFGHYFCNGHNLLFCLKFRQVMHFLLRCSTMI